MRGRGAKAEGGSRVVSANDCVMLATRYSLLATSVRRRAPQACFTFSHFFVRGLENGKGCTPNFQDGLATDYVVDAVLKSAKSRKWEKVKQA